MKKFVLALIVSFALIMPNKSYALDPKAKAFMVMTAYGTVGGALLGFASMAFGGKSRAIAQGASLGLYAGIIFGAYVISSYNEKKDSYVPPPEEPGYYNDPYAPRNDQGFGAPVPEEPSSGGGFFGNRVEEINDKYMRDFGGKKIKNSLPPLYINFFNRSF